MKQFMEAVKRCIKGTDYLLLLTCAALSCLSIVLIFGLTKGGALVTAGGQINLRPLKIQAAASFVGLAAAIVLSNIDYHVMIQTWKIHQPVSYILLLLTFTPLGVQVSEYIDDRNWLAIPGLPQFQPSELLKLSFILTFALHLSKVKDGMNDWKNLLLLCLHGSIPVLLIHLQGDDGTAVVMLLIVLGMLFVAGLSWKYILPVLAAVPPAVFVLWKFVLDADKKGRILALISPDSMTPSDLKKYLWQQMKGEIAIGNGGVWGNGVFSETGQFQFVPEVHNDFIFSFVGEALGFVGSLAVLALLLTACICMLRTSRRAQDDAGRYICVGVFTMFAAQMVINISMNLSLFPVIGITLPFLSAGGTSVAALYLSIGVVSSVYKYSKTNLFRD